MTAAEPAPARPRPEPAGGRTREMERDGAAPAERLLALDGLRGVAALVVLLYHLSKIAQPIMLGGDRAEQWRLVTESPLKIGFAGTEAVLVFFALSGLVVALPALREGFSWTAFLGARLLRLYLPVWAALALGVLAVLVVPRADAAVTEGSWLARSNPVSVDPLAVLREATLLPESYRYDNVLWSLRWEIVFSLLLPVFVALALVLRRWAAIAIPAALALSVLGRLIELDALVYLPVFLAGTLLAVRLPELRDWAARRRRPLLWAGLALLSGGLLIASWWDRPFVPGDSALGRIAWGLAAVGAVGAVVLAIGSPLARAILGTAPARWLGRISFSLYLVHVPIIATLAFALGDARWPLVVALGVPLSLLVAAGFAAVVERPAHRAARAAGRALGSAAAARRRSPVPSVR